MTDKTQTSPLMQLIKSMPNEVELLDENDQPIEDGIIELNDNMKRSFALLMLESGDSLEKVMIDTIMQAVDRLQEEEDPEDNQPNPVKEKQ